MTAAGAFSESFAAITAPSPLGPGTTMVEPETASQAAACLRLASQLGVPVVLWGSGRHQGFGHPVTAQVAVASARLDRIVEVIPADLVAVVESGVPVGRLEEELEDVGLTAALPDDEPAATVGGVVAAGLSGWTRLRYGPTRDRILEVVVATGDGRVVRGGGRVVKNVSGYDLPRLLTGSLGALGLITSVALKLWPRDAATAMVATADPAAAAKDAYRPLAVLEDPAGSAVYLGGTPAALEAQAAQIGGPAQHLVWPATPQGPVRLRLRVPPGEVAAAVARVRGSYGFVAAHGVGEIRLGADPSVSEAEELRTWAAVRGGSLVVEEALPAWRERFDPWGTIPSSQELQRRVKAAFDPGGIVNPGILPGGI